MGRFRAWLKKLLGLKTKSKPKPKLSTGPPPILPTQRPRPLTPVLGDSASVRLRPQPPTCLLFAKVPGDLRLTIFDMAFARRRIHIDLIFDNDFRHTDSSEKRHANSLNHEFVWTGIRIWRWGGYVCNRYVPNWQGPWCDQWMLRGKSHWLRGEGAWSGERQVGIMGFLLSCRQDYTEGIHVLFAGNCFTISSTPLLAHLPQIVLPQRLGAITSLEVFVNANLPGRNGRFKWDLNRLPPILDNIVTHCRNLRRIKIALGGLSNLEFIDGDPLIHLDTLYRSLQLREMVVELPEPNMQCYRRRGVQSMQCHPSEPLEADDTHYCMWRCLDGEVPQVQQRYIGTYPYPPPKTMTLEDRRGNVPSTGYWVGVTAAFRDREWEERLLLDSEG